MNSKNDIRDECCLSYTRNCNYDFIQACDLALGEESISVFDLDLLKKSKNVKVKYSTKEMLEAFKKVQFLFVCLTAMIKDRVIGEVPEFTPDMCLRYLLWKAQAIKKIKEIKDNRSIKNA